MSAVQKIVSVDLAGKSLLKVKDAMPPYDPTHEPDAEFWRPDPASWVEFKSDVQLIADGGIVCAAELSSPVDDTPEFSADVWTHQRLDFVVPLQAKSLDLLCFFPSYTVPGIDGDVQPKPMRFHLSGPIVPDLKSAPGAAEKKVVDDGLIFYAVRHSTATTFAGENANEGERFLIVDIELQNTRSDGAEFTPKDQLVWFDQGSEIPLDEISAKGALAPARYFHLTPGECCAFQAVWRVPAKATKVELGFKGNAVAEKYLLALKP